MLKGLLARTSLGIIVLTVVVLVLASFYTLPPVSPTNALPSVSSGQPITLPWPASGQAAIGAQGFGVLATAGDQTAFPIASVAKIVTALAVLNVKPLKVGEQGPTITLNSADVAAYQMYVAEGGSVVPVTDGEQISEYQALEAMILPSANNMAFSVAAWAFSYLDNYTSFARSFVASLGMSSTTITDPSGFNPTTVSTASDLIKLAEAAMANPVLAQIVGQQQATVPVAGTVTNTNFLLGSDGVIGIKTGNTDQAGGCYLFAAQHSVLGQNLTIFGSVVGAPDLVTALREGRSLVESVDSGFQLITAIHAGQTVATYNTKWGTQTNAIAQTDLSMLVWRGQALKLSGNFKALPVGSLAQTSVGSVKLVDGSRSVSIPVITNSPITKPSLRWRLTHP